MQKLKRIRQGLVTYPLIHSPYILWFFFSFKIKSIT